MAQPMGENHLRDAAGYEFVSISGSPVSNSGPRKKVRLGDTESYEGSRESELATAIKLTANQLLPATPEEARAAEGDFRKHEKELRKHAGPSSSSNAGGDSRKQVHRRSIIQKQKITN